MTLSLYMDENVPRQITLGLKLREVDVLTVQEDGRVGNPDPLVLQRATELERILFTRDEDFLAIARTCQQESIIFSGIIFAPQQTVSIGDCVRDLELLAKLCSPEEFTCYLQYLPL